MSKLHVEEAAMLNAFERGRLKSVSAKAELAKFKAVARATAINYHCTNIRLSAMGLNDDSQRGDLRMKNLFLMATVTILSYAAPTQALPPTNAESEKTIVIAAEQINKKLPFQLDKITRLDSVAPGPGKKLTYFLTLTGALPSGISVDEFRKQMSSFMRNSFCSDPSMQVFLRDDVVLVSKYAKKSGEFLAQFETTRNDCAGG